MAKSHKDRDKYDLPRVPEWVRAKPEQVMEDRRVKQEKKFKKRQQDQDEY